MIGRRTVVGVSLLCALAFCAIGASSASATGTTAFTCVEGGGSKDFSDAHCDNQVKAGEGKFGHVKVEGSETELTFSNEKTASETTAAEPSVLAGPLLGVNVSVSCKKVAGTGTVTNGEVGGVMQATGNATLEHSECVVTTAGSEGKCLVKEPIVYTAKYTTFQNETAMGVEFTPKSGKAFGAITYVEGSGGCPIKGTFNIEGSFLGTPGGTAQGKGATWRFADTGNLHWGSSLYTLSGAVTARMKGGNPITFTT
jgi:hypothetical protein